MSYDYDVLVVGSGFGGIVAALRLTEKGYRVGVLEAGARFDDDDVPDDVVGPPQLPVRAERSAATASSASTCCKDCLILSRRGRRRRLAGLREHAVRAARRVLRRPAVAPHHRLEGGADAVLRPGQADARRRAEPDHDAERRGDEAGRRRMGVGDTFQLTPVGVFFGRPGACSGRRPVLRRCRPGAHRLHRVRRVHDRLPARGQEHADRRTTSSWPRQAGAEVHPLTTVTAVRPLPGGGYAVDDAARPGARGPARGRARLLTAEQVVFAAGALGTQRLLHRMRDRGALPQLRRRLGCLHPHELRVDPRRDRPTRRDVDFSAGWRSRRRSTPTPHTHVEPVRYGKGSNAMGAAADGAHRRRRRRAPGGEVWLRRAVAAAATACVDCTTCATGRSAPSSRWSCSRCDNSITTYTEPSRLTGRRRLHVAAGPRRAEPDLDPGGQRRRPPDGADRQAARRAARRRAVQHAH